MRAAVVICGANGERGALMEKAVEAYAPRYLDRTIQFSACTVAASPIILELSGVDGGRTVSVNGCGRRCSDLILRNGGIEPGASIVLDDAVERELGACQACSDLDFDVPDDESEAFAGMMGDAVESALR